jgi:PhnB protein
MREQLSFASLIILNDRYMKSLNPYFIYAGNAEDAFNFYKSVFGGEFAIVSRFKEMPAQPGTPPPGPDIADKIMHVSLPLKNGNVLMGSDACGGYGPPVTIGNNVATCLHAESEAEGKELFDKLSKGGNVSVPYGKQFWGDSFGQFTDQYGVNWQIDYSERG